MTIRWPDGILKAQTVNADIAPRTLAGPSSISGNAQVIASSAGIWKATLGDVVINTRDRARAFYAVSTVLEGRLNPILVPLCRAFAPIPAEIVGLGLFDGIPHDDDAYFSDGAGYSNYPVIGVTASAAASAGATSLAVSIAYAGTLEPGMPFSIGERLYRVQAVVYASDSVATLSITPPLREAVSSGAILNFDDPVCRMRLATDGEMDLPLGFHRYSRPSVNFIEDL